MQNYLNQSNSDINGCVWIPSNEHPSSRVPTASQFSHNKGMTSIFHKAPSSKLQSLKNQEQKTKSFIYQNQVALNNQKYVHTHHFQELNLPVAKIDANVFAFSFGSNHARKMSQVHAQQQRREQVRMQDDVAIANPQSIATESPFSQDVTKMIHGEQRREPFKGMEIEVYSRIRKGREKRKNQHAELTTSNESGLVINSRMAQLNMRPTEIQRIAHQATSTQSYSVGRSSKLMNKPANFIQEHTSYEASPIQQYDMLKPIKDQQSPAVRTNKPQIYRQGKLFNSSHQTRYLNNSNEPEKMPDPQKKKIYFDSNFTQAMQRGSSRDAQINSGLIAAQKNSGALQQPQQLTKVVVAVTKDGIDQDDKEIVYQRIDQNDIKDSESQREPRFQTTCLPNDYQSKGLEILLPKFDLQALTLHQTNDGVIMLNNESLSSQTKRQQTIESEQDCKVSIKQKSIEQSEIMSYNTAENDFAMIVRGINSLINNSNNTPNNNDSEKFTKIIRRAHGKVVQTGKFAESQPQVVFEETTKIQQLGIKGFSTNIERKSQMKQVSKSSKRRSPDELNKSQKQSPQIAINQEIQNYTMREELSQGRTPTSIRTKKVNEDLKPMQKDETESLYQRNFLSALDSQHPRATETEKNHYGYIQNSNEPYNHSGQSRNQQTSLQTDDSNNHQEKIIKTFGEQSRHFNSLLSSKPYSPKLRGGTQHGTKRDPFNVQIDTKPARMVETVSLFLQGQNQRPEEPADYHAILQQQHHFEKKTQSSQIENRRQLLNRIIGKASEIPTSLRPMLVGSRQLQESVSFFHARMTSKNSSADSQKNTQSRYYSLPRGKSFTETKFEYVNSAVDEQVRDTAHQKRHIKNDVGTEKSVKYKTHHKGLFQMADISSKRVQGIKVSRLARPVDFNKEVEKRAISDLGRPSLAPNCDYQKLHSAIVEANLQQQALIDFKCQQSAFHRATKTQQIPMDFLKNAAAQFELTSPSPRNANTKKQMFNRIQKLKSGIEKENQLGRNQVSMKEQVFEVLFPKQKDIKLKTEAKSPSPDNLRAIISGVGQEIEQSRQNQQLMIITNQTNESNKIIQQIFVNENNRNSHFMRQQTLQKDSVINSMKRSDNISSVRKSFSKDGYKDRTDGDKISIANAKSMSTRIIINASNDRSLNSAEAISKSPISKIPSIRTPHEEKESTDSDVRDSQQKLCPIKLNRSELQKNSESNIDLSPSSKNGDPSQKITLNQSIESPRQNLDLTSSLHVTQINTVIGVTAVKITRNQKSDAELPSKSSTVKKPVADYGLHATEQSTKKINETHMFKLKGERCLIDDRSSATKRLESPPTLERKEYREMRQHSIRQVKKKSSIEFQMQVGGNSISSKGLKTQVLNSYNESPKGIFSMAMELATNKEPTEVANTQNSVISPTYSQIVTERHKSDFFETRREGKKETDRNTILKRMLNQVGLTQLKPKLYEIKMASKGRIASATNSESDNEVPDFRISGGKELNRIVKGLCCNQKHEQRKDQGTAGQKKRKKVQTNQNKPEVREDCVKVQTQDAQLLSPVNLIRMFKIPTTRDGIRVTPTIEDMVSLVDQLQGFTVEQGKIKFDMGTSSVRNRVLINQYKNEEMLLRDNWLKRFDQDELQILCLSLPVKRKKTFTELELSSTEEVDSAAGVTYSQSVIQKIAESSSSVKYFAKFNSFRIQVLSHEGLSNTLAVPFCYMARLFLLKRDQLQSLISKCLVFTQDKNGQRLILDYINLEQLLSTPEFTPCSERESFTSFKLKATFYHDRLGEQITEKEFELIVELPNFEIIAEVATVGQQNQKGLSSFNTLKECKCNRILQHFLTSSDLFKLLQSNKLMNWAQFMESMIADGSFGGSEQSEPQEYLMQIHPLRCKQVQPDRPIHVDKNALLKVEYVTPFFLELVANMPHEEQHQGGQVVIASMELIPQNLRYLVGLFGDDLTNDSGQASFVECVANILNVYADADQSIFSLDVVNWNQLEQIQLLKVSKMVTKRKEEIKPWLTKMPLKEGSVPGYQMKSKRGQQKFPGDAKEVNALPQSTAQTPIVLNDKITCHLRVKPAQVSTKTKERYDIRVISAQEMLDF